MKNNNGHRRGLTHNTKILQMMPWLMCCLPVLPVIVLYYQHQLGLSFQDFLIGETFFAATLVLMEVPSGWLADVWKRKSTLILGAFIEMLGFLVLLFAGDFWTAMLAQVLIGIGLSFASGTVSALLYDDLLHHGREDEYRRLEGRRHGFGMYATGISAFAGGFLYAYDPYLPLWFSVVAIAFCMVLAALLHEPPRTKKVIERNMFYDAYVVMKSCLRDNRELAAIILFVSFMYGATGAGHWMQQPYYIELGIAEMWFGVFAAISFMIGGIGGDFGHVLEKRFRPVHILIGLWVVIVAFWALSGAVLWYHALFLLMISNAAYGMGWPVVNDAINRRVDSSRRATFLSVAALLKRIVFLPLGLLIGWVVDDYGVQAGLLALAGFLLVANIWNVRRLL